MPVISVVVTSRRLRRRKPRHSGRVALPHRNAHAALLGDLDRAVVAGVDVADDAHAGVVGEHALDLLGGQRGAVGDGDLAGVDGAADADTAAVVDARPTSRRTRC